MTARPGAGCPVCRGTGDTCPVLSPSPRVPCHVPRYRHTQAGLVTCGGSYADNATMTSCLTLTAGTWLPSHTLLRER